MQALVNCILLVMPCLDSCGGLSAFHLHAWVGLGSRVERDSLTFVCPIPVLCETPKVFNWSCQDENAENVEEGGNAEKPKQERNALESFRVCSVVRTPESSPQS